MAAPLRVKGGGGHCRTEAKRHGLHQRLGGRRHLATAKGHLKGLSSGIRGWEEQVMLPAGLDASVAFPQGLQPPRPWREPEMMAARTKPRWELLGQAGWLSTKLYCLTCLFAAWFQLPCSPPSPHPPP